MPDKWDQYAQPAQSGEDKWAQYAQPSSPTGQPQTGLEHELYNPSGTFGQNAGIAARNFGRGMLQVPYGIGKAITSNPVDTIKDMYTDPRSIDPTGQIPTLLDIAHGKGAEVVGNIAGGMLLGKAAGLAGEGTARLTDPIRGYRSPLIPESEAYARKITDTLGVHPAARPNTISTLGEHGPLLRDYLKSEGAGATPIEVSRGARNLGQEGTGFYQQHFIEPNQMQETGQGPVGEVYGKVTRNNRLLNPDYRKALTVETDAGQERKAALVDENRNLNKSLYDTLSARSGLPPEEVQAVNRRGASLQSLGDEVDAAQGLRAGGTKYGPSGEHIPYSNLDKAMRLVNYFRGGEEAVRGKKIGRLLDQMPGEPTPLPQPDKLQAFRSASTQEELAGTGQRMAREQANLAASQARKPAGLGPTEPPQATLVQPPKDYTKNFANNIRARSGENRANAIPPPEPPTPQNPLDKYLGRARETQEQSRLLRKGKQ